MDLENTSIALVYNAESGVLNAVSHAFQRAVWPDTYECELCRKTHGLLSMRKEWKQFLASLPVEKKIYHRLSFSRDYPNLKIALPAILAISKANEVSVLVGPTELDTISELSLLIALTEKRLDAYWMRHMVPKPKMTRADGRIV